LYLLDTDLYLHLPLSFRTRTHYVTAQRNHDYDTSSYD
jgi:hypothetical protein